MLTGMLMVKQTLWTTKKSNEFALLRNKWLGVLKALDQKQWQITNITKLRVAGMEDATL